MSPEECAKDLVNKFYNLRAYETMSDTGKRIAYGLAKESALITVNEILNAFKQSDDTNGDCHYANSIESQYYLSVKQHLENL